MNKKVLNILVLQIGLPLFIMAQNEQGNIRFIEKKIAAEAFESVDVFDVNGDKVPDLVSGSFWYQGPDFKLKHFIREQRRFQGDYYDDFSTIPFDVNEDGKMDFITGGWWGKQIYWMENPGKDTIWREHPIATTGNIETTRAWDIDGDGLPEIVPNNPGQPLVFYKKIAGTTKFSSHKVAGTQGHGLGFGDVNGDGRGDFILSSGWLEAPVNPLTGQWIPHNEFNFGTASIPIIVADVNKDGLADIMVGQGHGYGLDWYEQKMEKKTRKWIKHPVDPFNSQYHTMLWVDIDIDGQEELITGKRFRAHNEKDPGSFDPLGIYYFKWNGEGFAKQVISYGVAGEGKGTGIYFAIVDLDGNGWKDIIVAGKDGLSVIYNQGTGINK
jgi:hypothetical protein